jgi:uncharacterized paraquat-inducible protein A
MAELTQMQVNHLNKMTREAYDVQLGTLLNNLLMQLPKEKLFCTHCLTISEKTDKRGNCISCGAPFGNHIKT